MSETPDSDYQLAVGEIQGYAGVNNARALPSITAVPDLPVSLRCGQWLLATVVANGQCNFDCGILPPLRNYSRVAHALRVWNKKGGKPPAVPMRCGIDRGPARDGTSAYGVISTYTYRLFLEYWRPAQLTTQLRQLLLEAEFP
jgi:hypothetical protein